MNPVQTYGGEIVKVNGQTTEPDPAPASTFTYSVAVTMDQRVQVFHGVIPGKERWPDMVNGQPFNCKPIKIGTLVTVHRIGTRIVLDAREIPHIKDCLELP